MKLAIGDTLTSAARTSAAAPAATASYSRATARPPGSNPARPDTDADGIGDACDPLGAGNVPPVAQVSAVVALADGQATVQVPGSSHPVTLQGVASVPIGSIVDARKGSVVITVAPARPPPPGSAPGPGRRATG